MEMLRKIKVIFKTSYKQLIIVIILVVLVKFKVAEN